MRAGFIGAGKVGFSLGKYLKENGVEITGYFSKSPGIKTGHYGISANHRNQLNQQQILLTQNYIRV